jgi:preprotein translocase subunit YajC
VLINEGDRVISNTGEKGRVELIGGFGTVAYLQLEENRPGVHLTRFDVDSLTVIAEADGSKSGSTIRGIVRRADEPPGPPPTKGSTVAALKVGDRVQTAEGLEGEVVLLAKDGISAYVRPDSQQKGVQAYMYRLSELTRIDKAE